MKLNSRAIATSECSWSARRDVSTFQIQAVGTLILHDTCNGMERSFTLIYYSGASQLEDDIVFKLKGVTINTTPVHYRQENTRIRVYEGEVYLGSFAMHHYNPNHYLQICVELEFEGSRSVELRQLSPSTCANDLGNILILPARSPVFKAMLQGSMTEAVTGEISVPDCEEEEVVRKFLRYLYSDEFKPAEDTENIEPLLHMASKYQVERLEALCVHQLYKQLNHSNATEMLPRPKLNKWKFFREAAMKFISEPVIAALANNANNCSSAAVDDT